jgi:nucleoid DNA-binding protein
MDVAKYIGLFLLKNHFCYIHGLGNLELKKKPATYDGQALQPQQYEVLLTPTGSIDDNLANFIATNEQISISKAANALRDFSIAARTELAAGKDVVIPSIGKFIEVNGRIQFITEPNLQYTPPAIPVLRTSKRAEEEPSFKRADQPEESYSTSGGNVNWGRIILWVVILAAVIGAVVFAYRFLSNRSQETETPTQDTSVQAPQGPVMAQPDTANNEPAAPEQATQAASIAAGADGNAQYRVVIGTYNSLATAQRRLSTLTGNGNKVELVTRDSATYFIVVPVNGPLADTGRIVDSLGRFFGRRADARVYR